jgi:aminopeptidase N
MEVIDPTGVHLAREGLRQLVATTHAERLRAIYDARAGVAYSNDRRAIDDRRLKNVALAYLAVAGGEGLALVDAQYGSADNMTDAAAALSLLVDTTGVERDRALEDFYDRWKHDPLVIDKWFTFQAMSRAPDTVERVIALQEHPAFRLDNPNRVRSLVASFCAGNAVHFHRLDGAGYDLLAETVLELDGRNPQLAARLVSTFNQWRRYDAQRQALMGARLERIAERKNLSKDVFEIVGRALGS